jgi:hypothetical protein
MIVGRILSFVFLLGIWAQAASACPEAQGAATLPQTAIEIAASPVSGNFVPIGAERNCECCAVAQDPQSIVCESSKSLIVSYSEGGIAVPNASNPDSIALAMHTRASGFIARRSAPPPYLLTPRLRQ